MKTISFTGAQGNRLEADSYGEGARLVLLLHGGGQTRHSWRKTARQLAEKGFQAVCLDQRGHGASQWVANKDYAFWDYTQDLIAVLDQLSTKPIIVGASLGGIAGLYACGFAQDKIEALVLVDITPKMERSGVDHIQNFMRAKMQEGFATIAEAGEAVAHYIPNRTKPTSLDGLKKNLRLDEDGRYRWHWDPAFMEGPRTINTDGENLRGILENVSRGLTIPTLLVRGAASNLITQESADEFLTLCPHAKFKDVAGAGHMVAGDKNDVFAQAILDFLG
jgi:pimeloyl-ACP methyl ester carboxylesterase